MTSNDHAKLLGIFHLVQAALQIVTGIILVLAYLGVGGFLVSQGKEEQQFVGGIFIVAAFVFVIICAPIALLFAYSGWKLYKSKPHSKVWLIVASVICLPSIPLGTALGVYGLWFACGDIGKNYFDNLNYAGSFNGPPPPPNSWQ